MNETPLIQNLLKPEVIDLVVKVFQVVFLGLFLIYSFLTIRQIAIMNKSLLNSIRFELTVLAYFQLFLGIGVLLVILVR